MTYDERKMCVGYANLTEVADLIQHIYRVGADGLLSVKARRKLSDAETNIQSVMGEMYNYVASHTESEEEDK